jgi:predicted ArsR family transcriptional regulator
MGKSRLDNKFFESTRGKIVLQLRSGNKTVNDLAAALALTDNAIRANLLTLERDHLIEQSGSVKGHRKPHFSYRLTSEARHLFPRSFDSLFIALLSELKSKLSPSALISTLRSLGRRIGGPQQVHDQLSLDERIDQSLLRLEELGGSARVVSRNGKIVIKSESCPFAEAVTDHPEVCQVAEAMVQEIVGEGVKERCDRSGEPKCCFEITPAIKA